MAILDAARHENDAGDHVFSCSWTSVLNNRTTNELKVGHVRESLLQGPSTLFDADWNFIGFAASIRSTSVRRTRIRTTSPAPRNTYAQDLIRDITVDDTLTWIKSGWGGEHSFKIGGAYSRNARAAAGHGRQLHRHFHFPDRRAVQRGDPTTYPYRFGIGMGQFDFDEIDHRASGFISGQVADRARRLTLNLGVRYDWQKATPNTKDAIGPRVGVAYDVAR